METLTIRKPDDWHVHLRSGALLKAVLPFTEERFARAIVMPNFAKPLTTTEDVQAYKKEIEQVRKKKDFTPLMTYYLTDTSDAMDITHGFKSGVATAVKYYPAKATTHAEHGVSDIQKVYPVFEAMQKIGMPLLIHGETLEIGNMPVETRDREAVFLDTLMPHILKDFPELKVVLEHLTTKEGVQFVKAHDAKRLAATVTVHHLILSHEDVEHASHPGHLHCMPVVKSPEDRAALRAAVTSGDVHFFLGTDSAPHPVSQKESDMPPAGIFTAPAALELYAGVFEEEGKLENFEKFSSLNGPAFYELPPNKEKITLKKKPWTLDALVETGSLEKLRPFGYHENPTMRLAIQWKFAAY